MVYPKSMYGLLEVAKPISGWDCALLTFISQGFDCGSNREGGGVTREFVRRRCTGHKTGSSLGGNDSHAAE